MNLFDRGSLNYQYIAVVHATFFHCIASYSCVLLFAGGMLRMRSLQRLILRSLMISARSAAQRIEQPRSPPPIR